MFEETLKIGQAASMLRASEAYRKQFKQDRDEVFRSLQPVERYRGLSAKSDKPNTAQDMADWCNETSEQMGINRTDANAPFYLPPAIAADFQSAGEAMNPAIRGFA